MPDSTTNLEMQDVLSSIRRLVSDEREPARQAPEARPERFLLTPAHRIHDAAPAPDEVLPTFVRDTGTPAEAGADAPRAGDREAPFVPSAKPQTRSSNARQLLEARIAELEAAVGRANEEWEPDGSERETGPASARRLFSIVDNDKFRDAPDAEADEDSASAGPLKLADVAIFTHVPRQADRGGSRAPVGSEDLSDMDPAKAAPAVPRAEAAPSPLGGAADAEGRDGPAEVDSPAPAFVGEVDDSALPPVIEPSPADAGTWPEAAATVAEQARPAERPEEATPPAPGEQTDAAPDTAGAEPGIAPLPEIVGTGGELVEGDEHVFVDEDVLRRVVADVVRDELQGKLGERITRNVRKMVRREIEQTLALRDFD